jgi:DNA/RNA-binding domain of Phe-tRNA-synthetase-like protein
LVLVHPSRGEIIFVEMKTERGKLRPEQIIWQDALIGAGARYFLWRPSMFAEVEATLRGVGWERRKGE